MTPLQSWVALLILLALASSPLIYRWAVSRDEKDADAPCGVCGDRATWGAWDLPACAVPVYCKGCGGLLGFDE